MIEELNHLGTTPIEPNRIEIPSTIEGASLRNYATGRRKRMGQWESIGRVWKALLSKPLLRLAEWESKSFRNRAVIWLITRIFVLTMLVVVGVGWVYEKLRRED
jgi:hypothetical protein